MRQSAARGHTGFRDCGGQAPQLWFPGSRAWVQQVWGSSFAARRHVGSSQIWDQTCVSCVGRRILYHWATQGSPICVLTSSPTWVWESPWLRETGLPQLLSPGPDGWWWRWQWKQLTLAKCCLVCACAGPSSLLTWGMLFCPGGLLLLIRLGDFKTEPLSLHPSFLLVHVSDSDRGTGDLWCRSSWAQEAHILVPAPLLLAVGSPGKEFSRGLVSSSVNEDLDHGIWGVSTRLDILWLYESTEQRPLASAPVKEERLQAAAKCSRIVRALQHAGTCTIIGGSEVQVTQAHE